MKWLALTALFSGERLMVNMDRVELFRQDADGTTLAFNNEPSLRVQETFAQIAAALGVSEEKPNG